MITLSKEKTFLFTKKKNLWHCLSSLGKVVIFNMHAFKFKTKLFLI